MMHSISCKTNLGSNEKLFLFVFSRSSSSKRWVQKKKTYLENALFEFYLKQQIETQTIEVKNDPFLVFFISKTWVFLYTMSIARA